MLMMFKPFKDVYYLAESIFLKKPEHFIFNYKHISTSLVNFPSELNAFSSKTTSPKETIDFIFKLKI